LAVGHTPADAFSPDKYLFDGGGRKVTASSAISRVFIFASFCVRSYVFPVFSDAQGGVFLPGTPTDITVSRNSNWLAGICTAADGAHVAVFAIDHYRDLKQLAIS
jgi:hypothetical protein